MKSLNLAIIGAGVMGEVILNGIIEAGVYSPQNLMITAQRVEKIEKLHKNFSVNIATDNRLAASFADIILLAVKPADVQKVLKEMVSVGLKEGCLIISIAAGVSIDKIIKIIGRDIPVIRVMTNTPCQIG